MATSTSADTGAAVSIAPSLPKQTGRSRIDSIDLLRGIVMVIMMLDHTRDFIHYGGLRFDPTDLAQTNTALFLTRWITHYCAPVFVFLAGTGIYLQAARGKSKSELSRFLITRGFWLIVLEFTVVRLGATFSFDYRFFGMMQVIWVIGASMMIMAALIYLPLRLLAALALLMIFLHNAFDSVQVDVWRGPPTAIPGFGAKLWMIMHQPFAAFPVWGWPSPVVVVIYPLIPWVAVMAVGYAFGQLFQMDRQRRRKLMITIGVVATTLFVILRAIDKYGDPSHWSRQKNLVFTVLSFVNTTKYPPSLLFLLMTLGPALIALAFFERWNAREERTGASVFQWLRNFFITFGRVPLFFYLLQWPTAHLLSVILHWVFGKPVKWLFESPIGLQQQLPDTVGFDLWVVYACWIVGVLLLYPLCKWFAGVKQQRRDWWLSYL